MKSLRKIIADSFHYFTRHGFGSRKWKNRFAYYGEGVVLGWPSDISLDRGFISIGDYTNIRGYNRISNYLNSGYNGDIEIRIGKNCSIMSNFSILNASKVTIGDNVLIASHVLISSENHTTDPESELEYKDQPLQTSPVSIGDGCWIGEKVCILPGVTIGKKCVIGAGSIVTKDVPDYCMAVGNPAKIIKRYNFSSHSWEKYAI